MTSARSLHTANLLIEGKVLLAGGVGAGGSAASTLDSAELYDPGSRTFSATSSMSTPRLGAASVRLRNGHILMAGGEDASKVSVASVERYNPASGNWTLTGPMNADRVNPTATLLNNGKVLVVGGYQGNSDCCALASAELYDPTTDAFTYTGSMLTARRNHTATLLENGKVLIAGGYDGTYLDAPELYDPATGSFSATGSMGTARRYPSANLLFNGKVLIAGGYENGNSGILASANLYTTTSGTFAGTGAMTTPRGRQTATLLSDGKVLLAGGYDGVNALASADLYDAVSGIFAATGSMSTPRWRHTETQLLDGDVLIAGGSNGVTAVASAEVYDAPAPTIMTAQILSAAWGTHAQSFCPGRTETDFDNMPVTFNWFINPLSYKATDFIVYHENGEAIQPVCAIQWPHDETDELQTINLIGYFGKPIDGQRPSTVSVIGELEGRPPGARSWRRLGILPPKNIIQLEAPPFIVDAWMIPAKIYKGDANRCKVGAQFVRVMWSNGITAYPTGEEVGDAVVSSYRAIFKLPSGEMLEISPLSVADLNDHPFRLSLDDNMHDLCLPPIPPDSQLSEIRIDQNLVQDPNGDPNEAQHFVAEVAYF
jgi:hypothetical protein